MEVTDQGIGIAREDLQRIFERFERAVPPRNFGGLGLGLYITRQIAEVHGGRVDVSSTPGAGFDVRARAAAWWITGAGCARRQRSSACLNVSGRHQRAGERPVQPRRHPGSGPVSAQHSAR